MVLPGFSIQRTLHQGERFSVVRALRASDQRAVVLKLPSADGTTPRHHAWLRHEYEIGRRFSEGSGVIAYLEFLTNQSALVLEDVGGTSLKDLWAKSPPDWKRAVELLHQLTGIIAGVHQAGVIHKDINSSNVIWNPKTNDLRLIDFELATTLPREAQQIQSAQTLEGTLDYLSPEQTGRTNSLLDSRSDLYSLGVLAFEALTGRLPFHSDDPNEIVHAHIARMPPSPRDLNPDLPPAAAAIVLKLLAKAPEARYQSAVGLAADWQRLRDGLAQPSLLADFVPGTQDVSSRFLIPGTLYGREAEIARLTEAFARVKAGGSELVLVTGGPGLGKSALIHEIHRPLASGQGLFLTGKFDQFGRSSPYSAFLQALSQLAKRLSAENPERSVQWKQTILETAGNAAAVLCDLIPELTWLIGTPPPAPVLAAQEAQNRFLKVLQDFLLLFAHPSRPLVIFIDDLQWADSASLAFLERLVAGSDARGLLILGAFRDQEVDEAHPLSLLIQRLERTGVPPTRLPLAALPMPALTTLTADTLGRPPQEVEPLVTLLNEKTAGNPFFFSQLLRHLYESGIIWFDSAQRRWLWDSLKAAQVQVSENVVDLMTAKIRTLPPETVGLLSLASSIGPQFDLGILARAAGVEPGLTAQWLAPALREELILPQSGEYRLAHEGEAGLQASYRFCHDRIQQASGQFLSAEKAVETHLRIGQVLQEGYPGPTRSPEVLFSIADHLNQAAEMIRDPLARQDLARINLEAGQKAKLSAAFESAVAYLEAGLRLLDTDDPWQSHYELTFALHHHLAEARALNSDPEGAETLYQSTLARAATLLDQAAIHEGLIHFYTNRGDFGRAYQQARQALKPFKIGLPPGFVPPVFIKDLITCRMLFRGRTVAALIDLPECTDPTQLAAMRLLAAVLKACYQIRPELCVANGFKLINLALRWGNMADTPVAFMAGGGIFLGSIIGNHALGYEFGKLALEIIERFGNEKQRAEVNFIFGYFVHFWHHPAEETEVYYRRAYESALQTGDWFHLACSACTLIESGWIRGVRFEDLVPQAEASLRLVQRIGSREAAGAIQAVLRAVKNLQGVTASLDSFSGDDFDEAAYEREVRTYDSLHFSHFYFINKMQTLYLHGRFDQAWRTSEASRTFLKYSVGMLHTTEHHFWRGMIAGSTPTLGRRRRRKELQAQIRRFHQWAQVQKDNFAAREDLLRAELAVVNDRPWEALRWYQQAAAQSAQTGALPLQALAQERMGRLLLRHQQTDLGLRSLQSALTSWHLWGAKAKVENLRVEFPEVALYQGSGTERPHNTVLASHARTQTTDRTLNLDLGTVLKATQAISRELRLESLLGKLVRIILENAGAQRGFILAPDGEDFRVEAEAWAEGETQVLVRDRVSARPDLSSAVLRYVSRSRESLVLDDAAQAQPFADDPALKAAGTKSLLCAPVLHQGGLVALIYLINDLTTGAFTPARLAVLQMLSAQAAISIENARHYDELETKVQERTRDLQKARETSDRLLLNILPGPIADELKSRGQVIPKVHRQTTVLFTDFSGFTSLASRMTPVDLLYTLGDYFSSFDDVCRRFGLEKLKTIGDAYMAVAGLPEPSATHAADACLAALAMLQTVAASKTGWNLRIGLHTGEVVAGVIGKDKFVYDIWGDTVNVASRMESGGQPGRLNVSESVWAEVNPYFDGESRGSLEAKNRGPLTMYFIHRLKPAYSADPDGREPNDTLLSLLKERRGR